METPAPFHQSIALVVIDLQAPFLKAIASSDSIVKRSSFAMEAAQLLDIPVLITEQVPEKLGPTAPDVLRLVNAPHVFPKNAFSCFGAKGFGQWLVEHKIEGLLICGLETPICVFQTIRDALREGINVTLLTDAVGGRRAEDHNAIYNFLADRTEASLLPAETVFYSLIGEATHPKFREFTALVKKYNN